MDLCRALAAVHGTDTLHGDVKAHNVIRGAGGRITLTDFGTSKDLSRDQRRLDGDFAGTPLYLAPEVFTGAPRTIASDIYSLGVLLFYLVTGTYPVDGATRTEVGRNHDERGARRLLRDVRPDLPDGFVHVVEQALADDPRARYASAGAFEAALNGVVSRRSTPLSIARTPVLVAMAVLLLAAIVALVAPWRERDRAGRGERSGQRIRGRRADRAAARQLLGGRRGVPRGRWRGPEARARRAPVDRRPPGAALAHVRARVRLRRERRRDGRLVPVVPDQGTHQPQSAAGRHPAPAAQVQRRTSGCRGR